MTNLGLSERDWQLRQYVYAYFVERSRPPTFEEAAACR